MLGAGAPRLANTSCLTMPGVGNQTQLIDLDLAGIAVSAGSACSSGKVGPSHVLAAMGVEAQRGADGDPGEPGLGEHRVRRGPLRRRLATAVRSVPATRTAA